MDNNGQLTFSDDPLLHPSNEVITFIEEGTFSRAVEKLDELLSINPDYPGLIESYRTAKFWLNRQTEINNLNEGKSTADFLMIQWEAFEEYVYEKNMSSSSAYIASMKYIFFKASEHYKIAYQKREETTNSFDLLLNLGNCFLRLEEYRNTIETLEYAKSSFASNSHLLSILAEAYYHIDDVPRSLLYFREAFLINPSQINLNIIKAKPVLNLIEMIHTDKPSCQDVKEWIPVYGFISDIFYVRKNLNKVQLENIKKDIYTLELNYQKMNSDEIQQSNVLPRLINKYLWMLDYYEFQNYNFDNLGEIKTRLITLQKGLFKEYFQSNK